MPSDREKGEFEMPWRNKCDGKEIRLCNSLSLSHTHRLALSICFCHLQQFEEVSVYNSNYSSQFQFQLIAMSLIFLKQFYTYYKYDKEGIFFHWFADFD